MNIIEPKNAAETSPHPRQAGESINLSRRRFSRSGIIISGVLLSLSSRAAVGGNFVCQSPSGFLSGNASVHGTPTTCGGHSPGYWGTHPEQWPFPYEPGKCGSTSTSCNTSSSSSSDSSSGSSSSKSADLNSSNSNSSDSKSSDSSSSSASCSSQSSSSSSESSSSNSKSSDSSSSSHESDSSSNPKPSDSALFKPAACTNAADWSGGTKFSNVFDCQKSGSSYAEFTMMQVIWLKGNQDSYQLGAHLVAALLNARMGLTPILPEPQIINIFHEWDRRGYFEPTAGVKWYASDIVAYLQSTLS